MRDQIDAFLGKAPAPLRDLAVQKVSRRMFLGGAAAGLALAVAPRAEAFPRWAHGGHGMAHGVVQDPLVFVSIDPDGTVTLVAHRSEMGTGSRTSLPMVMADEMEADWARVKIMQAPGDEPKYGNQNTDGSRSMRHHIQAARVIGASVRRMLRDAAAEAWGVPPGEVKVEMHQALHGGKTMGFGELAEAAMARPVPDDWDLSFKDPSQFRYIGKGEVPIYDLHDITTGKAVYGADVSLPGMKYAVIARPPVVGGVVKSVDDAAARASAGVSAVEQLGGVGLPGGFFPLGGVAVVADNTWNAMHARDLLKIEWEDGPHAAYESGAYMEEMKATAAQPGVALRTQGEPDAAFAGAAKVIERTYTQAHMAHAAMEPPVALANVTDEGAEVWAPVQSPYQCRTDVAKALGLDPEFVTVHVTLLGGGFGRKSQHDFAIEAAVLSQKVGAPVRVQWTREDDIRHSFMHTTSAEHIKAAVDADGKVTGWRHNSTAPSILSIFAPDSGQQFPVEHGMGLVDMPFAIPNVLVENGKAMAHTRIAWFRSVSNIPRAWAIGSFVSELAEELGKDEKTMWRELIGAPRVVDPKAEGYPDSYWDYGEPYGAFPIDTGRLANVLDIAADAIGYGKDLPEGEGIGLAVHRSFVTYVACAVRVKVDGGRITVPEMHLAVDAGYIANPERAESQMQGAAVMGMTTLLHSGITYAGGAVQQSNFYDYDVVRSDNYPIVQTHLVKHGFGVHPGGLGEPGVPPVPPAIANALFHATGQRMRDMPIGVRV
ncbi:molybdopterin cofactor-binding domain-containing protein [Rhodovulum sp. DZ06]|uniref:xanthine dehydrogenase family protein molybdopterin-binding subunit n=1 Tax=Rhodovulum sp. DZ06 TaxID=3425126 RepID=UPI003D34B12C